MVICKIYNELSIFNYVNNLKEASSPETKGCSILKLISIETIVLQLFAFLNSLKQINYYENPFG